MAAVWRRAGHLGRQGEHECRPRPMAVRQARGDDGQTSVVSRETVTAGYTLGIFGDRTHSIS